MSLCLGFFSVESKLRLILSDRQYGRHGECPKLLETGSSFCGNFTWNRVVAWNVLRAMKLVYYVYELQN